LTNANPPYLNGEYCNQSISGYFYLCTFSENGYQFVATPEEAGSSGTGTYTVITGGIMTP
jgi:hypothetical protein